MLNEITKDKEIYNGKQIIINDNDIEIVHIDEVIISNDKTKTLVTGDIHTCICLLVIGKNEVGMAHLNISDELNMNQHKILKQLLNIANIIEIDSFIGPKTTKEVIDKLNKYIPTNIYLSYINNPLGIDVATGNIAYKINDEMLCGYNDDGFVEYKKGYVNALNSDEFIKKI